MSVEITSTNGRHINEIRIEPQTLTTTHGDVEMLHVFPSAYGYLRGQVQSDEQRVVFSQGWGERIESTITFAEMLARAGLVTTLFDYPQVNDDRAAAESVQRFRSEVFHGVLDSLEGKKRLVAHSEGAYSVLDAAATRDDISAAMLAAPAGLSGVFRPHELVKCAGHEAWGAIRGTRSNVLGAAALARAGYGLARNALGNPKLSWAEILSIASTDARPDLERAIDRNVRLGIVACSRDRIFPAERIVAHLDGLENKIERFTVLEMNHFNFLSEQKAGGEVVHETQLLYGLAS